MYRVVRICAICAVVAAAGCSTQGVKTSGPVEKTDWNHEGEFTVRVNRIEAPDIVAAGTRVKIRVWGQLGPDGSYRFGRFEVRWDGRAAIVDVIGIRRMQVLRTMAPTEMRGVSLIVVAPESNTFEVVFNRFGLEEIRHVIRVEGQRPN
jgi:hypothetical protein